MLLVGLYRAKWRQGSHSNWEHCWCCDTRKVCRHRSWIRWSRAHENSPCTYFYTLKLYFLFFIVGVNTYLIILSWHCLAFTSASTRFILYCRAKHVLGEHNEMLVGSGGQLKNILGVNWSSVSFWAFLCLLGSICHHIYKGMLVNLPFCFALCWKFLLVNDWWPPYSFWVHHLQLVCMN